MSADAEQVDPEEAEAEVEEQAEEQTDGDQPEMSTEDMADLDAIAEQVEAETAPDPNESSTTDEVEDSMPDGQPVEENEDAEDALDTGSGESWGDMYVGTLTTVSNALIEEHGTEDAEEIEEQLARQLHLDEHFDEFMAKRGKSEMPPEQALLLGTTMFMVVVVGTKTDIPSQIIEEADF